MPACMHVQSQIQTRGRGWKGSCLWLKCYHPHLCRALPCQEHMLHQIPSVCSILYVAISTKAPLALIFQIASLWNCASSSLCLNVFNQFLWDFGFFLSSFPNAGCNILVFFPLHLNCRHRPNFWKLFVTMLISYFWRKIRYIHFLIIK